MQRRCRVVQNRSHRYHNRSPSLFKGCSHAATKNTRLKWSDNNILAMEIWIRRQNRLAKFPFFGGKCSEKRSNMCSILQVKPCMVPTRRWTTLMTWFAYKITENIYFCPPLHRHIQVQQAQQQAQFFPKISQCKSFALAFFQTYTHSTLQHSHAAVCNRSTPCQCHWVCTHKILTFPTTRLP